MSEVNIQILKPFGPSILKTKIPPETIQVLNDYIDNIIKDKKKSLQLDHGKDLVGDVTQEIVLEKKVMEESGWSKFLVTCISKWIELEMQKKLTKLNIRNSWVVRQFKNEYNPIHWHGGHISGAGFLKVPEKMGQHRQNKEGHTKYLGGSLDFIHGSKMFSSHPLYTVKPKIGDFYFFPNFLMHTVYPFNGTDEERRSISFNADIDENIFDVYGKG